MERANVLRRLSHVSRSITTEFASLTFQLVATNKIVFLRFSHYTLYNVILWRPQVFQQHAPVPSPLYFVRPQSNREMLSNISRWLCKLDRAHLQWASCRSRRQLVVVDVVSFCNIYVRFVHRQVSTDLIIGVMLDDTRHLVSILKIF